MAERETGAVKWFSAEKGYGFIVRDRGDDIFVHHSQIAQSGYRRLQEGQRVEYSVVESDKGLQAQEVRVIEQEPKQS
jgi:CspA family cold shock protein